MALPNSRTRTYATLVPVPPEDLNAIQDWIIQHPSKAQNWFRDTLPNGSFAGADCRAAVYCPGAGYDGAGGWVFGFEGGTANMGLVCDEPTPTAPAASYPILLDNDANWSGCYALAASATKVVAVGSVSGGGSAKALVYTQPGLAGAGLTPTSVALPWTGQALSVAYMPTADRFIAGGSLTGEIAYSNAAVSTWTSGTVSGTWGSYANLVEVGKNASGAELAVVFAQGTDKVMTSTDGITWTVSSAIPEMTGVENIYSMAYSPEEGLWLAVTTKSPDGSVYQSTNGTTWTKVTTSGLSGRTWSIACDRKLWVVTHNRSISYSVNRGVTWRKIPVANLTVNLTNTSAPGRAVVHGGGRFCLLPVSGREAYFSHRSY